MAKKKINMTCPLCIKEIKSSHWYYLAICKSCRVPMIVSQEHKPNFTEEEKEEIRKMFPNNKIQWEMRQIKDHAHCHLR